MIAANIRDLTQVAQLAFLLLRNIPESAVHKLCSGSSIQGIPLLAMYSASKFSAYGLTRAQEDWTVLDRLLPQSMDRCLAQLLIFL
ncbi:hypothetical protein N9052_02070 [bacterium]|nr:hypothetical protein [bacterium]